MNARLLTPASFRLILALLLSFCVTPVAFAQNYVTLAWDQSPDSNIAGYVVYWGTQSGVYNNSRDVGNVLTNQVTDLIEGRTYYFSVKAYNTSAFYSPASNEVTYAVPGTPPATPPTIATVTPANGPSTGGTVITITGTNFAAGIGVKICGVAAASVSFVNEGTVTATTPARAVSTCAVEVTNTDGLGATLANAFTYTSTIPTPVSPSITSVSPANGPTAGGTQLTISGANFAAGLSVLVCGTAATNVTVVNSGSVTARTPASASAATCAVRVVNPDSHDATLANAFTYTTPIPTPLPPTITSVTPGNGLTTGGTQLTIAGSNFTAGLNVFVCGTAATNVTVVNSGSVTARTPASASAATCAVRVVNPDSRDATLANAFTYTTPIPEPVSPAITGVAPATGLTTGGTLLTISGTNFASGVVVNICGVAALNPTLVNATTVTAQTVARAAGACAVQVVNPDSRSGTLANGFTYIALTPEPPTPTLTSVAPVVGPTAGGSLITLTGTNFAAGATVSIGGSPATSVTVVSATMVTAVTPAASAGARMVTIVNPSGRSAAIDAAFTYVEPTPTDPNDLDGDGLPDAWETLFGLDPRSAAGVNGANGDPDGDGPTNLQEYQAGTHPRGMKAFTRYFAEGADSGFFDTRFSIMNPQTTAARVRMQFMDQSGGTSSRVIVMAPRSRATVASKDVPSITGNAFSTTIESDVEIVADRYMAWGAKHYGSSAETGVKQPGTQWYLAEGSTGGNFDLYYLLQNPNAERADVEIRYLRGFGKPIIKRYAVEPFSRTTVHVDDEGRGLDSADVSADISVLNGVPIIVERSMYVSTRNELYTGGHESAAVEGTATEWFFAEGATGSFWSMYLLLMNPTDTSAKVTLTYMLTDGRTVEKKHTVPANQRYTIGVNEEDRRLANASMSTRVVSTNGVGVVAERAMWWPAGAWYEGANVFGATSTGTRWGLAEGEQGGADGNSTYVLVANTSPFQGRIRVTLLFEDRAEVSQEFALEATSRTNIQFGGMLKAAEGKRFSTLIESIGDQKAEIVVERAMYSSADGRLFSNGSAALGAKLQ